MTNITESEIEQATLDWFKELGYSILSGPDIAPGELFSERASYSDVILEERLHSSLTKINPKILSEAIEDAFRKLKRAVHESPLLTANNHSFHKMLTDGVDVEYKNAEGRIVGDSVSIIDFVNPDNNDWLAVNQFTVIEGQSNRRPDVVVFLNGLPLGVIELKNPADENATVNDAFNQFKTYKNEITSLFPYNEILIASDGIEARAGTLTADWEWFLPWRTVEGEDVAPKGLPELEVLIKGIFEKKRFLDLLKYFIVFEIDGSEITKKMAAYHQFHAVNKAVASEGVIDIFASAGLKKPDISILSDEFLEEVKHMPQKNLALEALRKLLNDEIKARSKKYLVQSRSFAEMLEQTIRKYQNRTIDAARVILELIKLAKDMREAHKRGEKLNLSEDELAFYDALETNDSAVKVLGDETLRAIAQELVQTVKKNVTIDWTVKESVKAKLRTMVKRILRKYGYPPDKQEKATQTVLQQAELLCKDWAA